MYKNIVVIGSSGAIGGALLEQLAQSHDRATIYTFSRHPVKKNLPNVSYHPINYSDEDSIADAAAIASQQLPIDLAIVATGLLHNDTIVPEKSLRELSVEKLQSLFAANTIFPALVLKHFLPNMNRDKRALFAALSARVGSISDNRLGGWHSYRASKAALNMIIKNASIEMGRQRKQLIVVGLHPGTVDSNLSAPFKSRVPVDKLFSPKFSAEKLISVMESLTTEDSGKCFAWDGQQIEP